MFNYNESSNHLKLHVKYVDGIEKCIKAESIIHHIQYFAEFSV